VGFFGAFVGAIITVICVLFVVAVFLAVAALGALIWLIGVGINRLFDDPHGLGMKRAGYVIVWWWREIGSKKQSPPTPSLPAASPSRQLHPVTCPACANQITAPTGDVICPHCQSVLVVAPV
jgi:hypothetical protein